MDKKTNILILLLLSIILILPSCLNSDDDGGESQSWQDSQKEVIEKVASSGEYTKLESESGNGALYYKVSDYITQNMNKDRSSRITPAGTPFFNDTVIVRYEGWYYKEDGKKYTFDSTEKDIIGGEEIGNSNNVGSYTSIVSSNVDGFNTILQKMKVGDEYEICFPYKLGYGTARKTTYDLYGNITSEIPGYSTLYFIIKLIEIKPVNQNEFD